MTLYVKQVVPDWETKEGRQGVYVLLDDGRLLWGDWDQGKVNWKDITPEDERISR